jgi:hypothetical protein
MQGREMADGEEARQSLTGELIRIENICFGGFELAGECGVDADGLVLPGAAKCVVVSAGSVAAVDQLP